MVLDKTNSNTQDKKSHKFENIESKLDNPKKIKFPPTNEETKIEIINQSANSDNENNMFTYDLDEHYSPIKSEKK